MNDRTPNQEPDPPSPARPSEGAPFIRDTASITLDHAPTTLDSTVPAAAGVDRPELVWAYLGDAPRHGTSARCHRRHPARTLSRVPGRRPRRPRRLDGGLRSPHAEARPRPPRWHERHV